MIQSLALIVMVMAQTGASSQAGTPTGMQKNGEGFYEMISIGQIQKKYVFISTEQGQLKLKDLHSSITLDGVKKDASGEIQFRHPAGTEEIVLSAWPSDGINGRITGGVAAGPIQLVKLASVWACGNHATPHLAGTDEEMKEHEQKYGCQLWHKVKRP